MTDIAYRPETPDDAPLADALIERAFGPGRHARAADRLREGNVQIAGLSYVALADGRLIGSVRLWPVTIGGRPAVFLGPIAVEAGRRGLGVGQALVEHACRAAAKAGWRAVLLVGDAPYFGRAGFAAAPAKAVVMPGPVDQRRVLLRPLVEGGAEGLAGSVRAGPARA